MFVKVGMLEYKVSDKLMDPNCYPIREFIGGQIKVQDSSCKVK